MPEPNIVTELRRVDDSFAMLKAGRDLDDRLAELLDGNAAPPAPSRKPLVLGLVAASLAIVAALALLPKLRAPDDAVAVTPPAPLVKQPAPAPAPDPAAPPQPQQEQLALADDVRFIEVPMGTLEVRAPSVVDVKDGRAVVVSGTARFLERGKAPRTLLAGQSIAWRVQPAVDKPKLSSSAPAEPSVTDADVDAALAQARGLQAKGSFAEAADVLAALLARKPSARVADTVGYERATLLVRARDMANACKALDEHQQRFPKSENAADVVAWRSRAGCR